MLGPTSDAAAASREAVPASARAVADDWRRLAKPTPAPLRRFDPSDLDRVPEPVRRWLRHSIAPGTPLATTVRLTMHGRIRLGSWRDFTATQILSPPHGFIWAATAQVAGLPVTGYDRYTVGTGQMRWRVLRLIPVMGATGPNVTRSAVGRLAAEGTVLLPTMYAAATWTSGSDPNAATATWPIDTYEEVVDLHIDGDGRLTEAHLQRWGNPDGQPYGRYPFGVALEQDQNFDGIMIPTELRAGWWWGTARQSSGEFFRARITAASFH
jgi:hypothetical protein